MNSVLLDNIEHKDLRILTKKSVKFGDNQRGVITFPTEFRDVQNEYPILFQKNLTTNEFQSIALLGFEEGQNLFLDDDGWHASYIPAAINRDAFLIGYTHRYVNGEQVKKSVIHVDMDSPRISNNHEGVPVFLPYGGKSDYLDRIGRMLLVIQDGLIASQAMFAAFQKWDLMEPFTLEVEFSDRTQYKLIDNYIINEARLYQLNAEALIELNQSGFLFSAYMAIASMANLRKLIDKRNLLFPGHSKEL